MLSRTGTSHNFELAWSVQHGSTLHTWQSGGWPVCDCSPSQIILCAFSNIFECNVVLNSFLESTLQKWKSRFQRRCIPSPEKYTFLRTPTFTNPFATDIYPRQGRVQVTNARSCKVGAFVWRRHAVSYAEFATSYLTSFYSYRYAFFLLLFTLTAIIARTNDDVYHQVSHHFKQIMIESGSHWFAL